MIHTNVMCFVRRVIPLTFVIGVVLSVSAQQIGPNSLQGMRWRLIGPHRGGRITSVSGVPSQPNIYYIGTPGGGVWKTADGGQVWKPIFDHEGVASIGAVAVAPSDPRIVYVGTGEQTQGNGVYKSTDAGSTWINIGLHETHIISGILVDPRNPDIVLVGVAGDELSGDERGVFKTRDGGKTWQKTLFKDAQTSVANLSRIPIIPAFSTRHCSITSTLRLVRTKSPMQSKTPPSTNPPTRVPFGNSWNAKVFLLIPWDAWA